MNSLGVMIPLRASYELKTRSGDLYKALTHMTAILDDCGSILCHKERRAALRVRGVFLKEFITLE